MVEQDNWEAGTPPDSQYAQTNKLYEVNILLFTNITLFMAVPLHLKTRQTNSSSSAKVQICSQQTMTVSRV